MPSKQRIIKNRREREVQERYERQGFTYLKKGWPDFMFLKGDRIVLVEVKRSLNVPTKKMGLSAHQRRMRDILSQFFEYIVEYVD